MTGRQMTIAPLNVSTLPLQIMLFGPLEVRVHGQPLPPLRSRKGAWLLALLALRQGRAVDRGWLAGTLWPHSPESQALYSLRRSLADLRQALGDQAGCLHSPTPHSLCLCLPAEAVDLLGFDMAIA